MLTTFRGISVVVMETKPKASVRKRVEERLAAGLCLHCDDEATRLGCCVRHYHQFRTAWLKVGPDERAVFRAQQIREGNIAESRQGQRTDIKNPFVESS